MTLYEALIELIQGWNQAADDGDRGPANDAVALILYDDGSGRIGTMSWVEREIHGMEDFRNEAELRALLGKYGVEWDEKAGGEA